eukprot:CAMPEP_0198284952 /NCGR_PEP_ID=MMETSP1449-20131203/4304_1 /TAXON_ID=420275 /ORGANISM="Attheya septentrionalis, Strain CCMP2084" /LENGTH=425 /DNA_ID=CAMNT_0043982177 /DNA_START=326 /DNA_END=1600 /DNA_ORIENTATION=+
MACCGKWFGRLLNIGAIGGLTTACVFLFLQLQVVTFKMTQEQQQLDQLKYQIEHQQQSQIQELSDQVHQEKSMATYHMALTFTLLTCLIAGFHITSHLRNMNEPTVQRKILAILWMSPIYGITSFLSLVFPVLEGYLSIIKDFYEAYVIYQFLSFLIAVLGREGDRNSVVDVLARHEHLDPPYKCLNSFYHPHPDESDWAMANAVLMECQILVMQFVFFRPMTSIISFVLFTVDGNEKDDSSSSFSYFASAQFLVAMIQNVSVFFAFAGLLKFYHAVRDDLLWCQPFSKFLTIKGIVFMTFWQGMVISIVFHIHSGTWKEEGGDSNTTTESSDENSVASAASIQNLLICLEMLIFSIAHWCVFPIDEWEKDYRPKKYEKLGMGFKDFVTDVNMIMDHRKKSPRDGLSPTSSDDDDIEPTIPPGTT